MSKPAIAKDENLPPPELWTLKAGSAAMNCSLPIVYERIARGDIKAFRVGSRMMLDPQSVRDFMRRQPIIPQRHRAGGGNSPEPIVEKGKAAKHTRPRKRAPSQLANDSAAAE